MDIHKPKPVHGWRELASEIGVVVIGIVIALTGEQIVENLHWHERVSEAYEGLSVELGEDLGQAQERLQQSPCVEHRLDQLADTVEDAARTGRLPPMGAPGIPAFRTWDSGVWQSAISAQTVTHMDRKKLRTLTGAYEFIRSIDELNFRELDVWTTLHGLTGPGRRFDSSEAAQFRKAISEARLINRYITVSGVRAHQLVQNDGIAYDAKEFANYADGDPTKKYSVCQPIQATPPSQYGAAPMDHVVERAQQHPIS